MPSTDEQIGPYRIVREIGRGGQGAVYLADDTRLGRRIALKVLASAPDRAPGAIMRFHREATVASRLDHPGICAVFDLGRANGVSFIAMRYVEGESLGRLVAAARESAAPCVELPSGADESSPSEKIRRIVALIAETARALHVAHEAGIVHRDMKPGNIMVGRDGQPVILDFGIAREESPSAVTLTGTGENFGTPAYLAPEQLEPPQGGVDRRVDVYALGVTLYECLTLRRPFDAPTRAALYREITHAEPAGPRRLNAAISPDLEVCVLTAVAKERDRRYQTAAAFADDLDAILEGRPIAARPVGAVARMLRWARREPAKAAVVALLAVGVPVLAALGAYVYATRDSVAEAERARFARDVEDKLEHGYFELGEGDSAAARAVFEEALRLDPDSIEAVAGLVLSHREADRYDEALAVVERHWSRTPLAPEVARMKPVILNLLDTRGAPESAPARAPTAVEAFLEGSRALQEGHRGRHRLFQTAFDQFEWAIQTSHHARALFYMQAMHATLHLEDTRPLERYARLLETMWPDSLMTRFYAASALKFTGRMAEALPALEALARERPDMAVIQISLGSGYAMVGRHQDAERAFRAAVARSPNSTAARHGLGGALVKLRKTDAAIAEIEEAIRLSPREPGLHATLGDALHAKGDFDGAIAEYRESLRLGPPRPWEIRHVLAARLQKAGRSRESIEEYRKVVAEAPAYRQGWLGLGLGLSKVGEDDEAGRMFEKCLELAPGDPEALSNLRVIRLRQAQKLRDAGELASVLSAAEDLARLRPGEADSHFVLATVREKVGDLAGAASAYAEATRLNAEYAEAWCNLGLRLWQLGRFDEALAPLRRGHELATSRPGWTNPSARWIASCEKLAAKDTALQSVLRGESRPASFEAWVEMGEHAHVERTAVEEVELLARAIAAVDDAEQLFRMRVFAARAGIRASHATRAETRALTTRPVPADQRAAWSRKAAGWLSDQVEALAARVAANEWSAESARAMLSGWLADPDFEPLRNPASAGEAADAWKDLRARIDAFLQQ